MSKPVSLIVISERGRRVGTHVPRAEKSNKKAPTGRIVAGPGQRLHEIEIERPEDLSRPGAIESFHELVRKKAKLK